MVTRLCVPVFRVPVFLIGKPAQTKRVHAHYKVQCLPVLCSFLGDASGGAEKALYKWAGKRLERWNTAIGNRRGKLEIVTPLIQSAHYVAGGRGAREEGNTA